MSEAKRTLINETSLERLLGLESSKIGFYADVKQKVQELETANLGLRVKTSELQAVFEAISDIVVIYDHHGCVQHHNRVSPIAFPTGTAVGHRCQEIFHPDCAHAPNSCPVELALAGNNAEISFSTAGRAESVRYFDVTATPIADPNEATRALVFIRDVTDKRLNELQLLQAEKMSSIGMLAAGVANEINNPLTSVAGYSEALLRRLRDDENLAGDARLHDFKDYLNVIIRESYRCKGIIDSLLSFSRKSEAAVGEIDLNEILGEVLELVRHRARNERIEILEFLQLDLPKVMGDASGLRQVFLNLTMNALQAIDGPGMIEISTVDHGNQTITATISDSGCGMSPVLLEQIWDPFFTTKEVGKGIGLGLAVTYNIIKKHGGEIDVESAPNKGSKFTVRLPICQL
jgi:signal transduction histidine kinase